MPTYLLTSPEGKKYRVTGNGTGEEALAQLQSRLGAASAQQKSVIQPEAPQEGTFGNRFRQGMENAFVGSQQIVTDLQKWAQDTLPEGVSNVLNYEIGKGVPSRAELNRRGDVLKTAAQMQKEKTKDDQGFVANVTRSLGNPMTPAALLQGGPLWAQAFGAGAAMQGIEPSAEGKTLGERAQDAGASGAISAVAAPLMAAGGKALLSPKQAAKDIGGYLGRAMRVSSDDVATFAKEGIKPTLGDVSQSAVVKRMQNMMDDVPIASSIIEKGKTGVKQGVEQGLAKAGFDDTLENAIGGAAIKKGLTGYVNRSKARFAKAFDAFDSPHLSTRTQPAATTSKISEIMSRADSEEALRAYLGAADRRFIDDIMNATKAGGDISYRDLKLFRSSIGKALDDYTIGSSEKGVLRELYGSLTDDMRQAVATKGADKVKAFDKLNSMYAKYRTNVDDNLQSILSKDEVSQMLRSVKQGVGLPEKTASIMRALPANERQIARGALIREMGMSRTQAGTQFDPTKFAAEFMKLEPKAREAFMSGMDSATKRSFANIVDIASKAKSTSLMSNPSGTARNIMVAAATTAGGITNAALTAKLIASGALTAKAMTSPKFIKWLTNAPKGVLTSPKVLADYSAKLSAAVMAGELTRDEVEEIGKAISQPSAAIPAQAQSLSQLEPGAGSDYLQRLAMVESSGNPNAKAATSSATGLLQFTDGTWKAMVEKYGDEHGLTMDGRLSPEQQMIAGELFTKENAERLTSTLGREPTEGELYAAHFLGAAGAIKLLKAKPTTKAAQKYFTQGMPIAGKAVDAIPDVVKAAAARGAAAFAGKETAYEQPTSRPSTAPPPTPSPVTQTSTFNTAVNFVLNEEGGYVADDAGKGETNMGVNTTANPDVNIKGLTPEKAIAIYKQRYWDKINGDYLPPALAMVAFDGAVNQGVAKTKELLKKSGGDPMKLIQLRKAHYDALVKANPKKFGKYYDGWMSRLNKLAGQLGG